MVDGGIAKGLACASGALHEDEVPPTTRRFPICIYKLTHICFDLTYAFMSLSVGLYLCTYVCMYACMYVYFAFYFLYIYTILHVDIKNATCIRAVPAARWHVNWAPPNLKVLRLMTEIPHDSTNIIRILPYFPEFWYLGSCRNCIINSRTGPLIFRVPLDV